MEECVNAILTTDVAVDADNSITIPDGANVTIDLNGKKLSGTADGTGNREMFLVKGTMNVINGTMEMNVTPNQGWNAMSTLFDVTAGGVLNIGNATLKNNGGTDMAFVVHMNNWGEVTLNVNNSTIESSYIAVRAFNSGNDKNNITIENSTLKGKFGLWVHNYTLADFGNDEEKTAAAAVRLNFDIYNNGNTFDVTGCAVLYGFTNSIRYDAYGNKIN